METSTTRGRFKKPIGSGTDVGTEDIVIGMMTIDIRAALLICGDIAFELVDICIVCILICTHRPLALMCMTWYNKSFFRSSSRYSWYDSTLVIVYLVYLTLSDLTVTYAGQQLANDRIGNSEALWFWGWFLVHAVPITLLSEYLTAIMGLNIETRWWEPSSGAPFNWFLPIETWVDIVFSRYLWKEYLTNSGHWIKLALEVLVSFRYHFAIYNYFFLSCNWGMKYLKILLWDVGSNNTLSNQGIPDCQYVLALILVWRHFIILLAPPLSHHRREGTLWIAATQLISWHRKCKGLPHLVIDTQSEQ